MQQDVETILIKISLEEIEDTLSRVKSELQTAHKRTIDPMNKLAANTAKSQMDFLEKELLYEVREEIIQAERRLEALLSLEAISNSRGKRALEFLGDMLSGITGVPSPRDHRKIIEQIQALKQQSQGEQGLMVKLTAQSKQIIDRFHLYENGLLKSRQLTENNRHLINKNTGNMILTFTLGNMAYKIQNLLNSVNLALNDASLILLSGNDERLTHLALMPENLSKILYNIESKYDGMSPIFTKLNIEYYYTLKLAHSWVSKNSKSVNTLLHIPVVQHGEQFRLEILPLSQQIYANLPMIVVNNNNSTFRFLSQSDYAACVEVNSAILCQKRKIIIFQGKCENVMACKPWLKTVVYDLTNTRILLILQNQITAVLSCDGASPKPVNIPTRSIMQIPTHCEVHSDIFVISKITYRQLFQEHYKFRQSDLNVTFDVQSLNNLIDSPKDVHDSLMKSMAGLEDLVSDSTALNSSLYAYMSETDRIWSNINPGYSGWEKLLSYSLIAGSLLISLSLLFYMLGLHWKLKTQAEKMGEISGLDDIRARLNRLEGPSFTTATDTFKFGVTTPPPSYLAKKV